MQAYALQADLSAACSSCHARSSFSFCMYAESDVACGGNGEDPDTPTQSDGEDRDEEPVAPLASTSEDLGSDLEASTGKVILVIK